ncbi:hypothetical protein AHF37_11898 [Paragonimus kellicotti]|nr:hypothetical protein AHF37_11898 [Paragonimus kellicotti]
MATAAIHAMRARAEQAMILNQVNESGSSNDHQSCTRINYDQTKVGEKSRQAEQFIGLSQITPAGPMIRSHLPPQRQLHQPHQQIKSLNCSNQSHSEFCTHAMTKRSEGEDNHERTHSGPITCQNTNIELTGLRNRQCALANKIATLQYFIKPVDAELQTPPTRVVYRSQYSRPPSVEQRIESVRMPSVRSSHIYEPTRSSAPPSDVTYLRSDNINGPQIMDHGPVYMYVSRSRQNLNRNSWSPDNNATRRTNYY